MMTLANCDASMVRWIIDRSRRRGDAPSGAGRDQSGHGEDKANLAHVGFHLLDPPLNKDGGGVARAM
jgi:hypothetical protein